MIEEIYFQRAQKNPSPAYRQWVLDQADLTDLKPHVRGLIYTPHQHDDSLMYIHTSIRSRMGIRGVSHNIRVLPEAFGKPINTAADLWCTIKYHEGFHAKELYENPWDVVTPPWRTARFFMDVAVVEEVFRRRFEREIRALRNVAENMGSAGVSDDYTKDVAEKIDACEYQLSLI